MNNNNTDNNNNDNNDNVIKHSDLKLLTGFHAVRTRMKLAPLSIKEVLIDKERKDPRMRDFLNACKQSNISVMQIDAVRLNRLCSSDVRHQGVIARVEPMPTLLSIADVLQTCSDLNVEPFLLVLDGITDPRNLGACLRVADGAGVHAVIASKDKSAPLNDIAQQTAAGATESVPYILVTNLARALDELVEAGITVVGLADEAEKSIYETSLIGSLAVVMGAEGDGMRRLTRERCDVLVNIPMQGAIDSLNVSVATGVVLYEALRQRL